MTKSYHPPVRGPNAQVGHWEGDMVKGEYVDRFVLHCPRHHDHLKDDCARCAAEAARAPQA